MPKGRRRAAARTEPPAGQGTGSAGYGAAGGVPDLRRLQPHRIRTFKRSNDPAFAAKVEYVVSLYMGPPAHAVLVSIDGRCMAQHHHQEFIKFLNAVERAVPAGKIIHAILDSYGPHRHPKVQTWLADHPRWAFHFNPTSAYWLNAVEGFFSTLTRKRLKRGIFAFAPPAGGGNPALHQ